MLVLPSQLCLKFGTNIKEMEWFKNLLVDHERHECVRIENSKQYDLKIENLQQNK